MPLISPGTGTKIKVCLLLIVISSCELQEYLYFIDFYVDFIILLKDFLFDLPRLDLLVLQGFTKVWGLGLKSCMKG